MLRLEALTKRFGQHVAVAGLRLEVPQGQILGVLGPNGAGKSTTISMIAGTVEPTSGRVVVDGLDTHAQPMQARRRIGLVPQDIALYEELSAEQNLHFFGSLFGLAGAALAKRTAWALEVASLTERRRDVVSEFSGGMKRRLNLAAGLLHAPKLLLLDEPTVGVDPQSRNHIFRTIERLRSEEGMTVLYSTHYMEEVQTLCDRVVIIDKGRIVHEECPKDVAEERFLTIEVAKGVEAAERIASEIASTQRSGHTLRVHGAPGLGPLIQSLENAGVEVRSVARSAGSLEERFLRLTGSEVRDHL